MIASLEGDLQEDFPVWTDNWPVIEAFQAVCTQWQAIALGMEGKVYWLGLNYAGVAAGLAGAGIAATPEIWAGIRVMEAAARNTLNGLRETD